MPLDIVAKQLGHANTVTVSNTYGHLAEQFRENQIRTRFTPLCNDQRLEAQKRRAELERLWQCLQTEDWRDYATLPFDSSHPIKSYSQTHREVLDVFARAERGKST